LAGVTRGPGTIDASIRSVADRDVPMPDRDLERARKLARVLDRDLVDPLLGLFLPGIGDLVGAALGLYLVAIAVRRHVSPVVIARMLLNLAADAAIGAIPILGISSTSCFTRISATWRCSSRAPPRGGVRPRATGSSSAPRSSHSSA